MKRTNSLFLLVTLLASIIGSASAQPQLAKDYSFSMEVPSVITMNSSPAHLYLLSDTEGMVVFRARSDSLQWLYSTSGMERRGYKMTADIRFAYLFGDSRRLTVLEPTSVLGVYSSTQLPSQPLDAERMDQSLFIAMGPAGLGRLDLSTPASVDSTVSMIQHESLQGLRVIDLEVNRSQLFVLTSRGTLAVFNRSDEKVIFSEEVNLDRDLDHIFVIGEVLLGSDSAGGIYEIEGNGNLAEIGSIGEPVDKIESWRSWLIIQGESNRLWTSYRNRTPQLWKQDRDAGNYFTVTQDQLWLCEYNQISRITTTEQISDDTTSDEGNTDIATGRQLNLRPIEDYTVPSPKPVVLPILLEGDYPMQDVQFAYQSNVQNAKIKGNGFYWQPQSGDIGRHQFRIIATSSDGQVDSTSFTVDVRSFNAPPRFSPIRPITIPVDESFTLPVNATDPDGMNPNLIRYIGVDLPDGSSINEKSGEFNWTPTARQVGDNTFQVIATDQYGAASQAKISIKVLDISRGEASGD